MPDAFSFALRPALTDDADALMAIDALCFPPGIAYPRQEIEAMVRARASLTLVAERSGSIAGFASMRLWRSRLSHAPRGELVTIDVLPQFRRERIGSKLYQGLEGWLREQRVVNVELHVAIDNTQAISFYERLGYTTVARAVRYYLGTLDAWRMEKTLPEKAWHSERSEESTG